MQKCQRYWCCIARILDKKEVEQRQGFAVTRPLRAIADLAAAESVSRDIIEQALTEGRQRGLITVREISELRRQKQLDQVVRRTARGKQAMKPSKKYASAAAFRVALEDRLKTMAQEESLDLQRVRRQAAFDRLLCRLFARPDAPWLLKGGYAMELRLKTARTTRDIDLALKTTSRAFG